ncbi:hypothetical protein AQUCO_01700490v1 [Aquilegia coerulea]|uniref:Subtilisin-like protease fibronectin type-III domain-containing protein n=1 Tax=Aquilegia coerulea TaxID=218851 RepID=A0A2G5DN71_AQUCA|nr:hypothetical protein AQUCO_01700490v1 [Aquilegia coerulea]
MMFNFVLFSLLFLPSLCSQEQTYIVQVQLKSKPVVFLGVEAWYKSMLPPPMFKKNPIRHVLKHVMHGYIATLTQQQVQFVGNLTEVIGVHPNEVHQLHTTHTPTFLELISSEGKEGTLSEVGEYGSEVVVGVLDTGIWPERASFSDEGMGPIPSHWKGECMEGAAFTRDVCNKKLIGARHFQLTYDPTQIVDYNSARDSQGHGTHTASTVAGLRVSNASIYGYAEGVASGIAPRARLAIYKVCWVDMDCKSADIVAAFDQAVEDGVDIISYSIGTRVAGYHLNPVAIAQFGAMKHGVFVSTSAGNNGPALNSVFNIPPWVMTVGSGTIDRKFPAEIILANGYVLTGESIYSGPPLPTTTFFPLIHVHESMDTQVLEGKIVVFEGRNISAQRGVELRNVGAVGMVIVVVVNDKDQGGGSLVHDVHVLPTVILTASTAAQSIFSYLASSKEPHGTIVSLGTKLNVKPAPIVASFSSRGPNRESNSIIKPDLIAPGVNILAAWPDEVGPSISLTGSDQRKTEFNILTGTSMSCPHVSGVAALLKGAHPDWSPSRIKSSMMTTAYVVDNEGKSFVDGFKYEVATPWAYGSGHVNPEKALDPGLVYDMTVEDYIDFLCASQYNEQQISQITHTTITSCKKGQPWDLNYPSISVSLNRRSNEVYVTRTVTQVSEAVSKYTVNIENPTGVLVTVAPTNLAFGRKEEKQSYVVKISAKKIKGKSKTVFGRISWEDGQHVVSMPIANRV